MSAIPIGMISHTLAAAAYLVLSLILLVSWKPERRGTLLVAASLASLAWLGLSAYDDWIGERNGALVGVVEVLRTGLWIAFLVSIVPAMNVEGRRTFLRSPALALGATALVALGLNLFGVIKGEELGGTELSVVILCFLLLAIGGLALVENLYRNTPLQHRWGIKFLSFGIGGIMAYDFFLYSEALLYGRPDAEFLDARGVVNAVAVPLLAISAARNPQWSLDVFVSRRVVFHSTAILAGGLYCLAMAAVGYYIRVFGGSWGPALQVAFFFAALTGLALILVSGRVRAWVKVNLNKHFFSYQYDYRDEWLRFIGTLSGPESSDPLGIRIIQAVANIVDAPDGAIWLYRQPDRMVPIASWNFRPGERGQAVDPAFVAFLRERQWIIDLAEMSADPASYPGPEIPSWLHELPRAWLVLPLVHHDRVVGILVLGNARASKRLNWEDRDLLKTIARQAASYLAEMEGARELAESRQFDAFNRRFAFVLHDIKNIVSQLSVMATNAETHMHNPQFREDMVETVKAAVATMNQLLVKLHKKGADVQSAVAIDLDSILAKLAARYRGAPAVVFEAPHDSFVVVADRGKLETAIGHLVQNAVDAVSADGRVQLRLGGNAREAVIEIEDNGPGMTAEFVRDQLFQPFKTTKAGGYGIGVYESREYVREIDGRLDVVTQPGRGTTMRITLPAVLAAPPHAIEPEPNPQSKVSAG